MGDDRPHQHIMRAAHAEQRRRMVKHGQPRRITGFARRQQADAVSFARGKLGVCVFLAADTARACRAAPPRRAAPDKAAVPSATFALPK
jgi:hypothetical protein